MAITIDGKVHEMIRLGKADLSVQMEYSKIKSEHSIAKINRNSEKMALNRCKENLREKRDKLKDISLLHPLKKYKALKEVRQAKRQYKIKRNEYEIAKNKLKMAQIKLRSISSEIKRQYSAMKQNEKMNQRMQKMQKEQLVTPSLSTVLEFHKQNAIYSAQVYRIDYQDSKNNTRISFPSDELYGNVNKTYAKHLKEKAALKSKKAIRDTIDRAHQIGDYIKNTGDRLKSSEPEMEM